LGSPTTPIKIVVTKEEETSIPLEPTPYSSKTQPISMKTKISPSNLPPSPKIHIIKVAVVPIKNQSPPCSPRIHNPMAGANFPRNRMDSIVVSRYAPLVLPQPMNSLPVEDYLKYMPKFTGEEDIIAEEHLAAFYSYVDNLNIENEDVWMRFFVQSLDGEDRKWFRGLTPGSIDVIEDLDDAFLRHWGDKNISYITLRRSGHLRGKKGNLFQTSQKDLIKCTTKFPLKSSL
jgi:hypothetical protein